MTQKLGPVWRSVWVTNTFHRPMSWLEPLANVSPAVWCARPAVVCAKLLAVTQIPAGGGVVLVGGAVVGGGVGPVPPPVSPQNCAV
jgi:hypothetical protein